MYEFKDIYDDIKAGASRERIHKKYGGFKIYIGQRIPDYKERILEEFNGYNYESLAYKYNTTRSNVEEIVKADGYKEPSLFE
jgi:Mor family transcriptional regulator